MTEKRTGTTDSKERTEMLEYSRKTILALIIAVSAIWIAFLGYRWKVRHSSADLVLGAEYTSISLKAAKSDIIIERGSSDSIVIHGSRIKAFKENPSGSSITVTAEEHIYANGIIRISLPYSNLKAFEISASAGDIDASSVNADRISISINAGDLKIADANADSISLSSKAGDIEIYDTRCNDLNIKASVGDIEAIGIDCSNASIRTSTGDIFLEPDRIENIDISMTTGDAEIRLSHEPALIRANTAMGDVSYNEKSVSSGEIHGGGTVSGNIVSTTGDISIYY